ncbi:MAG TPA: RNA polymerase sigma factor [Candidatus Nanopelagicales bacterium]|nr:RNA polymerase sigma factor [Candidatus Nanopelagicales bacterium]
MAKPASPVEQHRRHGEAREGADAESLEKRALLAMQRSDRRGALTLLVQAYGEPIYQYCHRVLRSRALADDVHQITFLQAYQDLGTFTGERFRPWLYAIAHNRCLDALKVSRRWLTRFSLRGELPDEPDPGSTSEERLAAGSLAAALEECLGRLQPHVRIAVALRYQEGFTYEEMARICRERPATLQARVARAMPALKRCLESKGVHR